MLDQGHTDFETNKALLIKFNMHFDLAVIWAAKNPDQIKALLEE